MITVSVVGATGALAAALPDKVPPIPQVLGSVGMGWRAGSYKCRTQKGIYIIVGPAGEKRTEAHAKPPGEPSEITTHSRSPQKNQSQIQFKCKLQTPKTQHSAFPVQRSSAWMKQNFELQINSKNHRENNLIFNSSAKFKLLKLNIQPSRSNGHQLEWKIISSCRSTQKSYKKPACQASNQLKNHIIPEFRATNQLF